MKRKKPRRKNPADLTKRNNDARKKDIAELKLYVEVLQRRMWLIMHNLQVLGASMYSEEDLLLSKEAVQPKRKAKR